ncbi:hypothetical protein [Halorientalis salina]|uniref:hypothetical protein n=1 Tax=Halorientalis salina TaxID=2932266 RepID=UPI0010ABF002|nr:hypothetical protein [Halorientalis salina]
MTAEEPSVTSQAELHAELRALLLRAHANGVEVKGGWDCRNGDDRPDWDVVVTEVETRSDSA